LGPFGIFQISTYLLKYTNTGIKVILMTLSANSNICISSGWFQLVDFSHNGPCFSPPLRA